MSQPTKERGTRSSSNNDKRVDDKAGKGLEEGLTTTGPESHVSTEAEADSEGKVLRAN